MENQMKYNSMFSLQEMVFKKMVIDLWSEPDILDLIMRFYHGSRDIFDDDTEKWRKIVESKVRDKIPQLGLPESLKKQMLFIVNPVGLQIRRWAEFHERYLNYVFSNFDAHILEKLLWTSAGLIDYRRTAEQLISCEILDTLKRYQLACLYCLDDDYISIFWEEFSEEIKRSFYSEQYTLLNDKPLLQFCWPYILKGEISTLDSLPKRIVYGAVPITFYQYAFEYSALRRNKAATKYFLQKLTQAEREASLIKSTLAIIASHNIQFYQYSDEFPKEEMADLLCYLLSQMNSEQQTEVFKEKPEVLCCFLSWPWQDLFLKISEIVMAFLPERDHTELLLAMLYNSKGSNNNFSNLFQEFYKNSPIDFRRQFVALESKLGSSSFIKNFYDVEDFQTIKVIFKNLDTEDRLGLVS